jgi:hypothetical protein
MTLIDELLGFNNNIERIVLDGKSDNYKILNESV